MYLRGLLTFQGNAGVAIPFNLSLLANGFQNWLARMRSLTLRGSSAKMKASRTWSIVSERHRSLISRNPSLTDLSEKAKEETIPRGKSAIGTETRITEGDENNYSLYINSDLLADILYSRIVHLSPPSLVHDKLHSGLSGDQTKSTPWPPCSSNVGGMFIKIL